MFVRVRACVRVRAQVVCVRVRQVEFGLISILFLLPENMKLLFAALFGAAAAVPLPHVGVTKSLLPPALIRLNVGAIKVRQNAVSCTFHFYFRYLFLSCQQIDARIQTQRTKMYTVVLLDLINHDTVLNSAQSNTHIYMGIYTYTLCSGVL